MDRFTMLEPLYRHSAAGIPWSESVVAWAVDLLGHGRDTPSRRILAGLPRGSYEAEVDEYFAATLSELGQGRISDVERCLGEARVIASVIVRGEVSPVEGAAAITGFAEKLLSVDPAEQLQLIEADGSTGGT